MIKNPLEHENPAGAGTLHWLQLPSGLEPMLLVIARFLSSGKPVFVSLGGNVGVGRMGCLLPGWLGRCNACRRG